MKRRPQPSARRGILRATAVVLALTSVAVLVIVVVSTWKAPAAKAPTVPQTPGPISTAPINPTGLPILTPGKPGITTAVPSPRKRGGLNRPRGLERVISGAELGKASSKEQPLKRGWPREAVASPDGKYIAYFTHKSDPYARNGLYIMNRSTRSEFRAGSGDYLVRPVWSNDSKHLLYESVAQSRAFPGARWSLIQLDRPSRRNHTLIHRSAMSMAPLGLRGRQALYALGNTTDTSVYAVNRGHVSFLGVIASQPLTFASLSPSGRYVAYATPTNCGYCTLSVYDLERQTQWLGPSGMPNEQAISWSMDGAVLVSALGQRLITVKAASNSIDYYRWPKGLSKMWTRSFRPVFRDHVIILRDTVNGFSYKASKS